MREDWRLGQLTPGHSEYQEWPGVLREAVNLHHVANSNIQVGGLRQLLDEPSEDEEEHESHQSLSPSTSSPFPDTHFVFGNRGQITDLRSLHPSSPQIAIFVEIYFTNVDPLFKILHKPTCSAAVLAAADNLANGPIDNGLEAIMFTIYFTATTSLSEEQCLRLFGQQRDKLLAQFKYGTEAALANADFLSSLELITLQAFAIYLVSSISYLSMQTAQFETYCTYPTGSWI